MVVSEPFLRQAVKSAQNIAHHYQLTHLAPGEPQRHVDHLIEIYQAYMRCPAPSILVVNDIDFKDSPVYSMAVLRDGNNLDIVLVHGLNHCWQRFSTAKEVFHAILDQEEFQSLDLGTLIETYLTEFPNNDDAAPPAAQAEFLAEVATMEFLFPYAARLAELSATSSPDFHAIAQRYRVPRVKVEKFLSKEFMEHLLPYHQDQQ